MMSHPMTLLKSLVKIYLLTANVYRNTSKSVIQLLKWAIFGERNSLIWQSLPTVTSDGFQHVSGNLKNQSIMKKNAEEGWMLNRGIRKQGFFCAWSVTVDDASMEEPWKSNTGKSRILCVKVTVDHTSICALWKSNEGKSGCLPGQNHCRSCLHRCILTRECAELPRAPSPEASWFGPETKTTKILTISIWIETWFYHNRKIWWDKKWWIVKQNAFWKLHPLTVRTHTIFRLYQWTAQIQNTTFWSFSFLNRTERRKKREKKRANTLLSHIQNMKLKVCVTISGSSVTLKRVMVMKTLKALGSHQKNLTPVSTWSNVSTQIYFGRERNAC